MTTGTFVALNRNVQVFTTNESDWDNVKGSVVGNTLTITCQNSNSNATVSWLVVGERQDDNIKSSTIFLFIIMTNHRQLLNSAH